MNRGQKTGGGLIVGAIGLALIALVIFCIMWGWAHFRLWRADYIGQALEIEKTYVGKAIMAEAEHARQARVMAAQAERDAAELTAEAIEIVGEAAQKYPEYRQQEFILGFTKALEDGSIDQIIYVPTEALIPITEAGKVVSHVNPN